MEGIKINIGDKEINIAGSLIIVDGVKYKPVEEEPKEENDAVLRPLRSISRP